MIINFLDGSTYNLDTSFDYKQRLSLVNEIINNYNNDMNTYWETGHGRLKYPCKTVLDILGNYLYYCDTKELNEQGILTKKQLDKRNNGEVEMLCGSFDAETDRFLNNFKEKHKKKNIKKSYKKYRQSKIHKLMTIYIPVEKRHNYEVKENPFIHDWQVEYILNNNGDFIYYIDDSNPDSEGVKIVREQIIKYTPSEYQINYQVNCFTDNDLKLPYIDKNKPYYAKWHIVDSDNNFSFCIFDYHIKDYKFDKVLILIQNNNIYFLDMNIELVKVKLKGVLPIL